MGEIKFRVHFLFIMLAALMIFLGFGGLFFCYLIVLILHELGHSFMAARLGYSLNKIVLMPQGALVFGYQKFRTAGDEIKVALAGPLVNIVLAGTTIALWWLSPESYGFTENFAFCNIITAALNLIPVLPLDGGRIMLAVFSSFKKRKLGIIVANVFGVFISFFCLGIFAYSVFYQINFTYLIMGVFLLFGMISSSKEHMYVSTHQLSQKWFLKNGVFKVNSICISHNEKLGSLIAYLHRGKFNICYITNFENGEVLAKLFDGEIYKLLETKALDTKLFDVI